MFREAKVVLETVKVDLAMLGPMVPTVGNLQFVFAFCNFVPVHHDLSLF
jgi:hypothetical protein